MKLLGLLLLLCIKQTFQLQTMELTRAFEICSEKFNETSAELESRLTLEDKNYYATQREACYMTCLLENRGVLKDGKLIDPEKIYEILAPNVRPLKENLEILREAIALCINATSSNPCRVFVEFDKCCQKILIEKKVNLQEFGLKQEPQKVMKFYDELES